jgi:hypothetical protein
MTAADIIAFRTANPGCTGRTTDFVFDGLFVTENGHVVGSDGRIGRSILEYFQPDGTLRQPKYVRDGWAADFGPSSRLPVYKEI